MARASLRNLSISELAEVSGLSKGTVSAKLNKAGVESRGDGKRKVYDAPKALRVLLIGDDLDNKRESARVDKATADLKELELAKKRGELLETLDVEAMGAAVMSGVTMRVMALRNIAPEIRAAGTDAEGAEILEDAAREALAEIARLGQVVGEIRGKQRPGFAGVDGAGDASAEADSQRVG